jgi:ABC-2 type transport system permease protein
VSPGPSAQPFTGGGRLLRFLLRRERRGLPLWLAGATALFAIQSSQSQDLYSDPGDLDNLRETVAGNPAFTAMAGPSDLLESIGGEVVFEIYAFAAVVVGLMNLFLVGRNTRSDEETGRAELIRSARVGRYAPAVAALALAALADVALAVAVVGAGIATGLPTEGSVLVGVALGGFGLTMASATLLTAQVFESARAVYGSSGSLLAAAFVMRAVGDSLDGATWLSWLSPMGWGQHALPYVANRWWTLMLPVVTSTGLVALASTILDRRDFGAGLVGHRPGRADGPAWMGTPLGLAWRLQRGSIRGWAIGGLLTGMIYGSMGPSIEDFVADNPELAEYLSGDASILDSYFLICLAIITLLAAATGVAAVLRARSEETSGRAEPVLATTTSRRSWFGAHLAVALSGSALVAVLGGAGAGLAHGMISSEFDQVGRLLGGALLWLPAAWVFVAAAAAAVGGIPRWAALSSWLLVGYATVVLFFGESFDLPRWSRALSPTYHSPQAPVEGFELVSPVALGALVLVLIAVGIAALERRDVATG